MQRLATTRGPERPTVGPGWRGQIGAVAALCLCAAALASPGCNGSQGPGKSAVEKPMADTMPHNEHAEEPVTSPDSHPPDPEGAVRLRQGTNPRVGEYELGVMSVGEGTRAGAEPALEIKLSVYHRASDTDEDRALRVGDTLQLGVETWELIRIEPARGDQRGYGVIAPRARGGAQPASE